MAKCARCSNAFESNHPLNVVCPACFSSNPKLSTSEKSRMNLWDKWADFQRVMDAMLRDEWCWSRNVECKYVELRIDMRDGGCIISDRNGKRISPEHLAWQYSDKTPNPPKD